ncbi:MAG TPA: endolytic transglycosylase MltG [Flavisolibacter sp.]|nr:endolytic transglycosylase MltG [Flavisolibacter sp.]
MKKILLIGLALVLLGAAIVGWIFLGPGTAFTGKKEYLYISSKAATKEAVLDSINANNIVKNQSAFNFLAERLNYWDRIRPGRYEVDKGTSLLTLVRMLRNGRQTPVNIVITKLRTKEQLARLVGNKLEFDSTEMLQFLNDEDSLNKFGVNTETAMFNVLPNTYTFLWNTTPKAVYQKLYNQRKKFWTEERKQKAQALGITPVQAYIIASIVEEETNYHNEKDTIASVYLNRLKKGMALGADPTIKFALKDFSIKWIRGDMLNVASPYNTYRNRGLPPGPICIPSEKTIDAVLAAPQTDYLFFVADSNFTGRHLFSVTYAEHLRKAKAFQAEDKRRREAREQQKPT